MRRLGVSRRELFESIERPAPRPLPSDDYEYAEWRLALVNLDYHVEAAGFLYSVPHALIRQQVDVRLTGRTVEIFHRGRRSPLMNAATAGVGMAPIPITCRVPIGAMPSGRLAASSAGPARSGRTPRARHRRAQRSTPSRARLPHLPRDPAAVPRARSCPGGSGLGRAIAIGALTYKSLASILAHNLDRAQRQPETAAVIDHPNLRAPATSIDGELSCSPIRRSTSSTPSACTAWPRATRARPTPKHAPSNTLSGSACCSSTRSRAAARSASRPAPAPPGCVIPPASRTSTTARRAGSTAPPS